MGVSAIGQPGARGGYSRSLLVLFAFAVFVALVAVAASAVTTPNLDPWYSRLDKPGFTPPGWTFGPVWTALYASMAVAAWLVWRAAGLWRARGAFVLFAAQLVLNGMWSVIFFGLRAPALALVEITVLWLAILATVIAFWRHSRWAGITLLPYLAWVSFAMAINVGVVRLN